MLAKNTLRKIKKSFGRYLSLFFIVFIGVAFFAGLQATAPDITDGFQDNCDEHNLMDYEITSTTGLTEDDVDDISELDGVADVNAVYHLDMIADQEEIAVYSIPEDINTITLSEGDWPEAEDECVADASHYSIGDVITITSDEDDQLVTDQYTVVGLTTSPLYLVTYYGNTTVGDGVLDSYIYIDSEDFSLDAYTNIWVTLDDTSSLEVFSNDYDDIIDEFTDELENLAETRESARDDELYDEALEQIVEAAGGMLTSEQAEAQYSDELSSIEKTTWYVQDRSSVVGYTSLESAIDTIEKVSFIIPIFFLLIVALMTSNTMARMIVEERGELGTLASLGVSNRTMKNTYMGYVLSATLLGGVIGFFFGATVIPKIIYRTFSAFILPDLQISYNVVVLGLVIIVILVLMLGVTISFCNMELHQMPSRLMRPVPPKNGQKILLEKVGFIWKRLTFTWKITIRNLFRYKQRVFMMLVGISSCTALLIAGFGLNDSIKGVAEYQYNDIFSYDYLLVMNSSVSETDDISYSELEDDGIVDPLYIDQETVTAGDNNEYDIYLYVPESVEDLSNYVKLLDSDDKSEIYLDDDDIYLTKNVADALGLEAGDSITIQKDYETYTFEISEIVENYLGNYIYMSPDMYETIFDSDPEYQIILGMDGDEDEADFASDILSKDNYANITFTSDVIDQANDNTSSLEDVIVLIVVVAVFLALIVLYNLTSINISERSREIATLKVLGFTDKESNQYIYREAVILTLIGIVIGFVLGHYLKMLVLNMIETEDSSFFDKIYLMTYVYSAAIMLAVTFIMQIVTYFKMKSIDMIQALKSVE